MINSCITTKKKFQVRQQCASSVRLSCQYCCCCTRVDIHLCVLVCENQRDNVQQQQFSPMVSGFAFGFATLLPQDLIPADVCGLRTLYILVPTQTTSH